MTKIACVIDGLEPQVRWRDVVDTQVRFPFAEWVVTHGALTGGAATIREWQFFGEMDKIPLLFKVEGFDVAAYQRGEPDVHLLAKDFPKLILAPREDTPVDREKLAALIAREGRPVITPAWLFPDGPVAENHQILLDPMARMEQAVGYEVPLGFAGRCLFASSARHKEPMALLAGAANTNGGRIEGTTLYIGNGIKRLTSLDMEAVRAALAGVEDVAKRYRKVEADPMLEKRRLATAGNEGPERIAILKWRLALPLTVL